MLRSSGRVKLNRVALKDVVGIKLVPRRKRVPRSPGEVEAERRAREEEEGEEEDMPRAPRPESVADAAPGPVPGLFLKDGCAGPETVTAAAAGGAEPGEEGVRGRCQARAQGGCVAWKPEGARTGDTGGNTRPSPAAPALRRPLSGDCKHVWPQQKTPGKKGQKSGDPLAETPKKIVIWIARNPRVTLCDVGQKCDRCAHSCGYVLPGGAETKAVRCFKREMRAAFRFRPSCLSRGEPQGGGSAPAKSRNKREGRAGMRGRGVEEEEEEEGDPGPGRHPCGDMRPKPGESPKDGDGCDDAAKTFTCQRVRVYCGKVHSSCARAYLSWPFSGPVPPPASNGGDGDAPPDASRRVSCQSNPRQEAGGGQGGAERTRKRGGVASSQPSDTPMRLSAPSGPGSDSSACTPSPPALGLSDWGPAAAPSPSSSSSSSSSLPPSPFLVKAGESAFFSPSGSSRSCASSSLLPQDGGSSDGLADAGPPTLEPYYSSQPSEERRRRAPERPGAKTEAMLPPLLSPVASPQGGWGADFLSQSPLCSEEEEEEVSGDSPQTCVGRPEWEESEEGPSSGLKTWSSRSSAGDEDKTDAEDGGGDRSPGLVPSSPEARSDLTSESRSSPGGDQTGTCPGVLDELAAYERDILLVDVVHDDPELFQNLPRESLLRLGPTRGGEAPKARPAGAARPEGKRRSTPVSVNLHFDSPEIKEESDRRPWRPQGGGGGAPSVTQSNAGPVADKQSTDTGRSDVNGNHVNGGQESRSQPIQTVSSAHSIPQLMTTRNGPRVANPATMTDFRRQKSNAYCRQYFSESLSCGFKMCRFQHVPVEGDEKFCVETVTRFVQNPACLQKAGAVFTGYYQNNPPGVYFSRAALVSLLWALLKAGMVPDILSVLGVSLAHKIVPSHEFLLALFDLVREKGLAGSVPELMQLTVKMANAGLALSLDHLGGVKNAPEFEQTMAPRGAPFPEHLNIAHAIVEIELCAKQEDWRRTGEVLRSVCKSGQHHPSQVEQICGRIAIALLSEGKDKLSLPFTAFAETVCQSEGEGSLVRSFLGRIGVSLMLRYHKTHNWSKGRRVVEVLSACKISYSTLKGLFGNEDGASRCSLVNVATELFFLSGSVEGALNTLRENNWFLSSCTWPCEPADLENRTRVLMRLAEKTCHRDTLEVLCNLPGVKEPNDMIDISRYGPLFNAHLQVCVDRQILPLASDTVDFMLSKHLAVEHGALQTLLHKLGKQNLWLRAREVFKRSLSAGYYRGVSAPSGFMALIVPCRLGEVELALALEMLVAVNAAAVLQVSGASAAAGLSITLKRTACGEGEYLLAGSRVLSAAGILQPKVAVHYTAVNPAQEQVFTLDAASARRWLHHNRLWAGEMWTY